MLDDDTSSTKFKSRLRAIEHQNYKTLLHIFCALLFCRWSDVPSTAASPRHEYDRRASGENSVLVLSSVVLMLGNPYNCVRASIKKLIHKRIGVSVEKMRVLASSISTALQHGSTITQRRRRRRRCSIQLRTSSDSCYIVQINSSKEVLQSGCQACNSGLEFNAWLRVR